MKFSLYNTLTKVKEEFRPLRPGKINIYVCGVTVYDYCHVGHARVMVAFDVITRYMRALGWDVNYVRNITDIDDKILKRAQENGESINSLTQRFIEAMIEDEAALGVVRPDQEPRATDHIGNIVTLINALEEKGFAYRVSNGDVYYRVGKFNTYGKLTNKNSEDLLAGARIAVGELKEDPRDFVLWKAAKEGEASWQSPWGEGRPGWHIECSAMSKACLGPTLDIHGGGPDLPFPHHENEIAQSEAANDCTYANYWMHAGAVRMDGEKMSKSLGNFFTIREVLKQYHPEVIRFLLISSHYRSAINYSEDNLQEAKSGLERFYFALRDYDDVSAVSWDEAKQTATGKKFVEAMNDDFNTRLALAAMYDLVRDINSQKASDKMTAQSNAAVLKALGSVLGLLQASAADLLQASPAAGSAGRLTADEIDALILERQEAKLAKNYGRSDEIRDELKEKGVVLEDSRAGTTWRWE